MRSNLDRTVPINRLISTVFRLLAVRFAVTYLFYLEFGKVLLLLGTVGFSNGPATGYLRKIMFGSDRMSQTNTDAGWRSERSAISSKWSIF